MSFRIPKQAIRHAVYKHNRGVDEMEGATNRMRQEVADIVEKMQNSSGPMERINSYDIEQAIIAEYGEEKEGRHHCETCNVWVKSLKAHAKRSTEHIARLEIDDLTEGGPQLLGS